MIWEKMKSFRFWRDRVVEFAAAVVVFFLISQTIEYRTNERMRSVPPEAWFEVNDIYVPDHEVGANPKMIYDRSIHEDHRGFWVVEAQRRDRSSSDLFFNACSGTGVDDYQTTDVIPGETVRWDWMFGRPCAIGPGVYRLQLTKEMTRPEWPPKRMTAYSNTFRVYPEGELPEDSDGLLDQR